MPPITLPTASLRIGVTGHTGIPANRMAGVRRQVQRALDIIEGQALRLFAEAETLHAQPRSPRLRLLTCCAPGFDQLVAEEWLARGSGAVASDGSTPVRCMTNVLPDLQTSGLSGADSQVVFHLEPADNPDIERSYWQAARFVVQHSDVIVAFWDERRTRKGRATITFRALALAEQLDIPVLLLRAEPDGDEESDHDATRLAARLLRVPVQDATRAADTEAATALGQRLQRHLSPYKAGSADPNVQSLHDYLSRRDAPPSLSERLLPGLWPRLWSALKERPSDDAPAPVRETRGDVLWEDYLQADRLAGRCMNLYRSSFLFTYGAGVLAVLLAVLVYLFKTAGMQTAALVTAFLEVAVISAILLCFWRARKRKWHTRGTESRLLAELLRHSIWTWQLGDPVARLPVIEHRPGSGQPPHWVRWYYAALLRGLDPGQPAALGEPRRFTHGGLKAVRERMKVEWFMVQREYHAAAAPRYGCVHAWTEKAVTALFVVVLVAAGLSLTSLLAGAKLSTVAKVLLLIGAVLPALAAALHGIANQLEAHRLHGTSERMQHALDQLVSRLSQTAPADAAEHHEDLLHVAADASRIMLHEADDWHASLSLHALKLP